MSPYLIALLVAFGLIAVLGVGGYLQAKVLVRVQERSGLGSKMEQIEERYGARFEGLRGEMLQQGRDLRRYVDESVSRVDVEGHTRDTEMRRAMEISFSEMLDTRNAKLLKQVEETVYSSINRVMGERGDEKARRDAAQAKELLLRAREGK